MSRLQCKDFQEDLVINSALVSFNPLNASAALI